MKQSNNVILFPKIRKTVAPVTKEDIEEVLEQNKQYHIQQTIDFLTPILFSHLNIAGFIPNESEFAIKEGAFIVESIRSHMFTHYGLKHPFQKIVDKVFIKEEGDDEGVFTIAKSIKAKLSE